MSTTTSDRQLRTGKSEQAALTDLVERLTQQFPELAREQIIQTVHGRYAGFDDSRVRDFVPVLVERAVRQELASATPPRHRA